MLCNDFLSVFRYFSLVGVFMLQVAIVLSGCCICFTHMLQVYVRNVSSATDVCERSLCGFGN